MFQAGETLSRTIALWEGLASAVRANLDEIPHAETDLAALEQLIASIRDLATQQDQVTAQLRELTRRRREEVAEGRKVRNRLVGHLQGHFGPDICKVRCELGSVRRSSTAGTDAVTGRENGVFRHGATQP